MYHHSKHFTLSEAQNLLSNLKASLGKMITFKKTLDEKGFDIYNHYFFGGAQTNGTGKYPKELEHLINVVKEITDHGILIKGIDNGLIDFPHITKNGDEVYLCYQYGEDEIMYWHKIEDGYGGRRSIEEL